MKLNVNLGRAHGELFFNRPARTLLGMILCVSGMETLGAQAGWASGRTSEQISEETSADNWFAQVVEGALQEITGVQVTAAELGFELILETDGTLPAPSTSIVGNALVVEIPDAVLVLPKGELFEQFAPAEGIALVQVTNSGDGGASPTENRVEIAITGTEGPPVVSTSSGPQGLTVNVLPGVAAAERTSEDLPEDPPEDSLRVLVTATRREESLDDIPRSVTVITREEIEEQTGLNRNVTDILSQLVPGASPPSGRTPTIFNIRGQGVSILVDGIAQDTNSNNTFSAPLAGLDPSTIERIEVIRGPNAVFGGQAIGGVVNIITRKPTEDQLVHTTELGIGSALTNAADGQSFLASQQISGRSGDFDFTGSVTLDFIGQSYDAVGDRIGDGANLDQTRNLNALLNLGIDLNERERLQLRANHTLSRRVSDFIQDTSTDAIPGIQKGRLIRQPEGTQIIGANDDVQFRNTNLSLGYTNEDLWGSEFQGQLYYRKYSQTGGFPFDNRIFGGIDIAFSEGETEQFGTRLQVDTPFNADETLSLLWGLDYSRDRIFQNLVQFDIEEFDNSGGLIFRSIGERTFIPPYEFDDLGLFAQLQWEPTDRWTLNGGTRYINLQARVDDYQTFNGFSDTPIRDIEGGSLNADGFVFNVGTAYDFTDNMSAFASFGQGFSFPDIGRVLRRPPASLDSFDNSFDLNAPVKVDNYELGIRGNWGNVQTSLAGFFSYSDSGFDVLFDTDGSIRNVRAPRRVYGVESTVDWQPSSNWNLGGTVSWQEGEFDEDEDGEFLAFDSFTVAPLKVTAYLENQTTPGWRNRLQLLYSGNRSRGFDDGTDGVAIEDYITVDLLSSIDVGNGEVTVGVRNLFNSLYFPVYAQANGAFYDPGNYAGSGTNVSVGYKFTW